MIRIKIGNRNNILVLRAGASDHVHAVAAHNQEQMCKSAPSRNFEYLRDKCCFIACAQIEHNLYIYSLIFILCTFCGQKVPKTPGAQY